MPIQIGNTEVESLQVGGLPVSEVYAGDTRVFPANTLDRNIYTDWVNDGLPFGNTSTSTGFTDWAPATAGTNIAIINQSRNQITITTVSNRMQRQTRACTAAGGCDGPYIRTIAATPSTTTTSTIIPATTENRQIDNPAYAPVAQAHWLYTNEGPATGGTQVGSPTVSAWSNWGGASSILPSAGIDRPTSATCNPTLGNCPLSRTRTVTTSYSGASQNQFGICTLTVSGSGSPRCSSPDGAVGATDTRTLTNGFRRETVIETQTISVSNDGFDTRVEFTSASIVVTACTVDHLGVTNVVTNFGTATSNRVTENTTNRTRTVTVTYSVSGTIPAGNFSDSGTTFSFSGLTTTCVQDARPATVLPAFNANSAQVVDLGNGINSFVANNGVITLSATAGYVVTPPTGNGIVIATGNGGGTFPAPTANRGRRHSFEIQTSQGTATYTFSVSPNT